MKLINFIKNLSESSIREIKNCTTPEEINIFFKKNNIKAEKDQILQIFSSIVNQEDIFSLSEDDLKKVSGGKSSEVIGWCPNWSAKNINTFSDNINAEFLNQVNEQSCFNCANNLNKNPGVHSGACGASFQEDYMPIKV